MQIRVPASGSAVLAGDPEMEPRYSRTRGRAAEATWSKVNKRLRILCAIALLGALAVGLVSVFEKNRSSSERTVVVYRLHGCTCVFPWIGSLQKAGFAVQVVELHSLSSVRAMLHTPGNLHGCHVAAYVGYFVEGHVAPAALRPLADKHPVGLGVTTATSITAEPIHVSVVEEERSLVLLVKPGGRAVSWFQPADQPGV